MDTMVVVVFDEESKAYEAAKAIKKLADENSIELYSGAIVTKDQSGRVHLRESEGETPFGMALGAAVGALIGALGGAPGAIAGASIGMVAGMPADVYNLGVQSDFTEEVGDQLQDGTSAVVAEIQEPWTTPLDTKMEELGGNVLRKSRADAEEDQYSDD